MSNTNLPSGSAAGTQATALPHPNSPAANPKPVVPANTMKGSATPVRPQTGATKMARGAAAATAANGGGSNSQAAVKAWLDQCKVFGEQAGAGDTSKMAWFEDMVERSNRKEIDESNAADGFNAWHDSRVSKGGVAVKPMNKATKEVRISEARKIIQWGGLPNANAPRVFGTTVRVISGTAALKGEVDDKILKVARAQIAHPDAPLTADEIKQLLTMQQERAEAPFVVEIDKLRKKANAIGEKFQFKAHLRAAINSFNALIEELGGTPADKKAADKAAREAEKKQKKAAKAKKK